MLSSRVISPEHDLRVESVRRFNRFYTLKLGVLNESYLQSGFSLAQGRVLYEVARSDEPLTATELGRRLGLDAGYLSRILREFEENKLIRRSVAADDARRSYVSLTVAGRKAVATLNARQHDAVVALLDEMPGDDQERFLASLGAVEQTLTPKDERGAPYLLRELRAGDYGWVLERHAVLYGREYGWDQQFEAICAEFVASIARKTDPRRERGWIAERNGCRVGCVFVVRESDDVARLRMLLVEPSARGLGIGKRLVEECTRFARDAGYKKITLWTHSVLEAARDIYHRQGYRMVHVHSHEDFGKPVRSETWELDLSS